MTEPNQRLNIALALEKAHHQLRDCHTLLEAESYDGAISPAYYAAYHSARALLLSQGEEPKTHTGLNTRLSLHFVRTGIFSPEVGSIPAILQSHRERATYDTSAVFTEGMAREAADDAAHFVGAAESWLRENGWS